LAHAEGRQDRDRRHSHQTRGQGRPLRRASGTGMTTLKRLASPPRAGRDEESELTSSASTECAGRATGRQVCGFTFAAALAALFSREVRLREHQRRRRKHTHHRDDRMPLNSNAGLKPAH
jgi:hypothetical protein